MWPLSSGRPPLSQNPLLGEPRVQRAEWVLCLGSGRTVVTGPCKARVLVCFHFFHFPALSPSPLPASWPHKASTLWCEYRPLERDGARCASREPAWSRAADLALSLSPTQDFTQSTQRHAGNAVCPSYGCKGLLHISYLFPSDGSWGCLQLPSDTDNTAMTVFVLVPSGAERGCWLT